MAAFLALLGICCLLLLAQEALAGTETLGLSGTGAPGSGTSPPVLTITSTTSVRATATVPVSVTSTPTVTPTITPMPSPSLAPTDAPASPTATLLPVSTPTPTSTASAAPTVTPASPTLTPSLLPSATPTPTPTPTSFQPTPTPTPTPTSFQLTPYRGVVAVEGLWGTAQACSAAPIVDPQNSIDLDFNDLVAWCGPFGDGDTWTYTEIQDTSLPTIAWAILYVRFYVTGLDNDALYLEANSGFGWQQIATFDAGNPSPGTLTTLAFDVSSLFTTPSQVNAAQTRFRTSARGPADPLVIYLDEAHIRVDDQFSDPTPFPPVPTPTAPPPAPTDIPGPDDPHVDYTVLTSSCAGCHRTHTAAGLVLRQAWPEEDLCFTCHTAGGPGTDVQPAFTNYGNTDTRFFKHDVAATTGVHRVGEMDGTDFGGANRHVECEDCHEPHEATRGPASPPMLQRESNYTAGVDAVWTMPGAPVSFTWLPQAEREYQVCFKCHASFAPLSTYPPDGWDGSTYLPDGLRKLTYAGTDQVPDSRDMAQEFNPYNASFHPVVATGRNQSIPPGSFMPGWSASSLIYCSDCHTNANALTEGDGPHGSPLLHLLGGSSDYQTANPDDPFYTGTELCFTCHDAEDYTGSGPDTNFYRGNRNLHGQHNNNGTCYLCHDTHGSEQLHLINLDTSIELDSNTYFLPGYDGQPTNSQTFWQISPSGTEKTCWLVCHGRDHGNRPYPNLGD